MAWTRIEGPTWLRMVGCVRRRMDATFNSRISGRRTIKQCTDTVPTRLALFWRLQRGGKVVARFVSIELASEIKDEVILAMPLTLTGGALPVLALRSNTSPDL